MTASAGHVGFEIDGNITTSDEFYSLDFSSPSGSNLAVGAYPGAARDGFENAGQPGLDFSGEGRGSDTVTGEFVVREISFDTSGNVLAFAANFVQHSEGAAPALTGQVRYNSTIPLPVIPGVVQFSSVAYSVDEKAGAATITVDRTGGSSGALSVAYATSNGTAIAGTNYTATSGTLTWADGDATPKTFVVPVRDDGVYTANLSLDLTLTGAHLGTIPQAVLTILNQDPTMPGVAQFSGANFTANETDGTATITVDRAGGTNGTLSVNYSTANGTAQAGVNYVAAAGTLSWADGDSAPKSFKVSLLDPVTASASQTVLLNLTGIDVGSLARATLTITNSNFPPPGAATLSAASYHANETDGTATITVNRVGGSFGALSVNYATANGTALAGQDYTATSGALSWTNGDSSPKTFTVPILDAHVASGTRTLLVELTGASLGPVTQAALVIADDEGAVVSVTAPVTMFEEGTGEHGVFIITRTGDTTAPLDVQYKVKGSAKPGVDYKPLSGLVTIPAGAVKAKVKIKPIDDPTADGTRVVKLKLLPSTNGIYAVGVGTAKIRILDHD